MKIKKLPILLSLMCCVLTFPSCSEEQEVTPEKSKEDNLDWGYFKGTVNEEAVELKNATYPDNDNNPIYSRREGIFFKDHEGLDSINVMNTFIRINDNSVLSVRIYKLNCGIRYIMPYDYDKWYDSRMSLAKRENKHGGPSYYTPGEHNPFRIEITDVIWLSYDKPIIEVKLNGALYKKDNLQDSIIINAVYGTR